MVHDRLTGQPTAAEMLELTSAIRREMSASLRARYAAKTSADKAAHLAEYHHLGAQHRHALADYQFLLRVT